MTTPGSTPADAAALVALASRHGLALADDLECNDLGLDFRVGLATDAAGRSWVVRVPRRPDVWPRVENEARVLGLVRDRLPVAVPDWTIVTPELIAYPRLPGTTAVTLDPATREPTWHIDPQSATFRTSLARALAALHGIDPAAAAMAGLKVSTPEAVRSAFAEDLDRVRRELGVGEDQRRRWRAWLDDDDAWPPFTALVHGDLHVGHVLVAADSRATGILDWTEAEVSDPAIDFIFHLMGFGAEGLDALIADYEAAGGRTWPGLRRQVAERLAAFPIKYALFALASGQDEHLAAVRVQLGVDAGSP